MLLVTNQTMKIREHTWTPVTITEVLTIPAAEPEKNNINIWTSVIQYKKLKQKWIIETITYQQHNVPPAGQIHNKEQMELSVSFQSYKWFSVKKVFTSTNAKVWKNLSVLAILL